MTNVYNTLNSYVTALEILSASNKLQQTNTGVFILLQVSTGNAPKLRHWCLKWDLPPVSQVTRDVQRVISTRTRKKVTRTHGPAHPLNIPTGDK